MTRTLRAAAVRTQCRRDAAATAYAVHPINVFSECVSGVEARYCALPEATHARSARALHRVQGRLSPIPQEMLGPGRNVTGRFHLDARCPRASTERCIPSCPAAFLRGHQIVTTRRSDRRGPGRRTTAAPPPAPMVYTRLMVTATRAKLLLNAVSVPCSVPSASSCTSKVNSTSVDCPRTVARTDQTTRLPETSRTRDSIS